MAKIDPLDDVGSLANTTSARAVINSNSQKIEDAFANTVSRDGSAPNQMEADFDLNDHYLLNVADPVNEADGVNLRSVRPLVERFASEIVETAVFGTQVIDPFVATAGQVTFPLSSSPGAIENVTVTVDGTVIEPNVAFTLSGADLTTLSVVTPMAGGERVVVRYARALPSGITDSGAVTFEQLGTSAGIRSVQDRLRDTVSVKDFLCADGQLVQGDGSHDDTTGIQAGINYVADNGGTLYFPPGDYAVTAILGRSVAAAKPFAIRGAGATSTRIVRSANSGSVFNFGNVDNFVIEDLAIVGSYAAYPTNANHGISFFNGSHIRVRRVNVSDWKNAAIIGYTFPSSTAYTDCVIEDCYVDGGNNSNNGILIADLSKSGIRNCYAVNIGKSGSPCYALQMKNGCQDSFIEGGLATGATIGVAIGNYDVSGTHTKNRVDGVRVFNCDTGIGLGSNLGDNISNCIIDMNNAGLSAVDFQTGSKGCVVTGLVVRNHVSTRGVARFRSGDTDNSVEIAMIENSNGLAGLAAEFLAGSLRNTVEVKRYANPTTVSDSGAIVSDASTGSTNICTYAPLPNRQTATIASDAITLRHGRIRAVRVDTEGGAATDDLATINGGIEGQIITINQAANARDVTIKHGTGNIRLNGAADFAFTTVHQNVTLMYLAGVSAWVEVSRGTAT